MKTKTRVISFVVLFLFAVVSGCVTQPTSKPEETTQRSTLATATPSQPISVATEHTDRTFTLFVAITKPLPYGYYLKAVLIQPDGDEGGSSLGVPGWDRSNINITLDGKFEGNNNVMLRNYDNKSEIFYQTNWTVRLPHYKIGENIPIKGLDITFKPYQITSAYDPNKKNIEIPIEGKNIISVKEKVVRICVQRLKVDKGYFYKPAWLSEYTEFKLEPEETADMRIKFEIPKEPEPTEMHGYFTERTYCTGWSDIGDEPFVLELIK